jgi:hypothetical protein
MKLRHVVLFGFKDGADAPEVTRRFTALKALIPGIEDMEWGENISPEALAQGHSHAFLLTFTSEQARDAYLIHPGHVAFSTWVKPFVSIVTVVDYWARG